MRQLRRVTKTVAVQNSSIDTCVRQPSRLSVITTTGSRKCGDGTEVHVRLAIDEEAFEHHLLRGDVPVQVEKAVGLDVVEVPEALGVERVELAGIDHPKEDEPRGSSRRRTGAPESPHALVSAASPAEMSVTGVVCGGPSTPQEATRLQRDHVRDGLAVAADRRPVHHDVRHTFGRVGHQPLAIGGEVPTRRSGPGLTVSGSKTARSAVMPSRT